MGRTILVARWGCSVCFAKLHSATEIGGGERKILNLFHAKLRVRFTMYVRALILSFLLACLSQRHRIFLWHDFLLSVNDKKTMMICSRPPQRHDGATEFFSTALYTNFYIRCIISRCRRPSCCSGRHDDVQDRCLTDIIFLFLGKPHHHGLV